MGTVARRTITKKVSSERKESFFEKLLKALKRKDECQTRKELQFLFRQIYQYYFDAFALRENEGLNIPEFMYEEERRTRAEHCALNELLYRVADRKIVSKLAQRRLCELNSQGIKITL